MSAIKCLFLFSTFIFLSGKILAQGHIDHIKNQGYLKLYEERPFDCDNRTDHESTTLHDKICANLNLQKSDSILTVLYDSLLVEMRAFGGDTLAQNFENLQTEWREFRSAHCGVIWSDYEGCGGCNLRAAHFMDCMKKLTDIRAEALRQLLLFYREKKGGRYEP